MTHPIFYIREVYTLQPKNKVQRFLIEEAKKMKFLTIADSNQLNSFEKYLRDLSERIGKIHPTCNKILINKNTTGGVHSFFFYSESQLSHNGYRVESSKFLTIEVSYIRGEWKGGIK